MDILNLVDRYFDSWNSHHALSLVEVFGKGGILRTPLAREGMSGPALAEYASSLWGAFPDFFLQTEPPLLGANKVSVEWVLRGVHDGRLFGCARTGLRVTVSGVDLIDCSGNHLSVRSYFDALSLLRQLDLTVPDVLLDALRGPLHEL
jgi:predicted ester cyclase